MDILVVGTGYVGTTTALVLAEMGWNVTGLDSDQIKLNLLLQGRIPFYEEGLEDLLEKHLQSDKINFTSITDQAIKHNDVIFICVGTPSRSDGNADLQYVKQVAMDIGRYMNSYKLIVIKSTVPVGTQEMVEQWIRSAQSHVSPFDVASNPEFLREGKALSDALYPDRIIIGTDSDRAAELLKELYQTMQCPVVVTAPKTAELIKYAANAFLVTKISYINELSRLCDKLGVNVKEVAHGIGLDPRIGSSFLRAGIGYGGSCFPKDVSALLRLANDQDTPLTLLKQAVSVNQTQYLHLLEKARTRIGAFNGKKISILGLAFKPDTDDIREAPAIRIIQKLLSERALISVHDPIAKLPQELIHESVTSFSSPEQALEGADAVFLCTEWKTYLSIDWVHIKQIMNQPNLFDGRNLLNAKVMEGMGYYYQGVGYP
ncbi:UDPglucose 6-dehydrogenase [Paenibacillus uliginis N3/975]|uniref:UDP-glucose 6-dehydrogenase n=1 Tax=Paenibacillus uliginis N3/975 TaxID=1313296 RepID=A0A1X7HNG0_9BACL|nr:UDP-glucose/GDP-mannose dehydrogenase family protein [Paenibacillus uliginis]SMF89469.1 UDPglucose 6-dehydrogenase [Paenibacillus uliginis N3/975]